MLENMLRKKTNLFLANLSIVLSGRGTLKRLKLSTAFFDCALVDDKEPAWICATLLSVSASEISLVSGQYLDVSSAVPSCDTASSLS